MLMLASVIFQWDIITYSISFSQTKCLIKINQGFYLKKLSLRVPKYAIHLTFNFTFYTHLVAGASQVFISDNSRGHLVIDSMFGKANNNSSNILSRKQNMFAWQILTPFSFNSNKEKQVAKSRNSRFPGEIVTTQTLTYKIILNTLPGTNNVSLKSTIHS